MLTLAAQNDDITSESTAAFSRIPYKSKAPARNTFSEAFF